MHPCRDAVPTEHCATVERGRSTLPQAELARLAHEGGQGLGTAGGLACLIGFKVRKQDPSVRAHLGATKLTGLEIDAAEPRGGKGCK